MRLLQRKNLLNIQQMSNWTRQELQHRILNLYPPKSFQKYYKEFTIININLNHHQLTYAGNPFVCGLCPWSWGIPDKWMDLYISYMSDCSQTRTTDKWMDI